MINKIKSVLKSNAIGRCVYPALNKLYRLYSVPARKRALNKHGYQVLDEVNKIANKEGFQLFPTFGTLLGFVRDGGFIKGDDDIDWGVMPCETSPRDIAILLHDKYGMTYRHGFSYHGEITEFCMAYKGVSMDFFFVKHVGEYSQVNAYSWHKDANYTDDRQNNAKSVRTPLIKELVSFTINGVNVMIPSECETMFEWWYGKGWKVPDPNYVEDDTQKADVKLDDFGYIISYEDIVNNNFNF